MRNSLFGFILILFFTSCTTKLKFPKEVSSNIKFCFLGDVGKSSKAQQLVAQALKYEKCHQIFFLGDIIYPNGIMSSLDSNFQNRFYTNYGPLSKKDNLPQLNMILGNHDHNGNIDAWLQIARIYPEIHYPAHFYLKKIKDICFIALDSNTKNFHPQVLWLKTQKPLWETCRYQVAMAHHPLYTNGPSHRESTSEIKEFYQNNIIGKFDILISGHEHVVEYLGEMKGTSLYLSGAGGAVAKNHLPGYITMEKMTKESLELIIKLKTK